MSTFIKRLARKGRNHFRLSTARYRPLPNFLIIGAQKAGTTSLFDWLSQHPQVRMSSPLKEVHYFSYEYPKGEKWYRSNFRMNPGFHNKTIMTGEASPYYLYHPHAPRRIHSLLPTVKLIALVRNPTERAISHYFHEVRHKTETLPILKALQSEEARIKPELKKMLANETYHSAVHQNFSYKQRGIYIDQIKRYLEYFDRDQLLILTSERLFTKTQITLQSVYEFLGVIDNVPNIDLSAKNIGQNRREIDVPVYDYLNEYFAPHNERFYNFLGSNVLW